MSDGSPIAVTVVRDCAGTVTSEGWLNLVTGAWSAGPPPAGTVACGDSRSITTNGTFCDVLDGMVVGLVLVEYQYAADGSIASVRLVDAVTGDTYTPTGEVTTCPAGVEQPERDIVQLCDVTDDESGTVTSVPFVRDYARDENGTITGHTDYTLDGQPYTPAGTVGLCEQCRTCTTQVLCDTGLTLVDVPPSARSGTLTSGVGYEVTGATPQFGQPWWATSEATQTWTFTEPVRAEWSARVVRAGHCLTMPEGTVAESIDPAHTWDEATRTLCGTVTDNTAASTFSHPGATVLEFTAGGPVPYVTRQIGLMAVAPESVTFQRTTCRGCDGEVFDVTDTRLDGMTPYVSTGTVGVCQPEAPEPCASAVTVLRLCDLNPDVAPDEDGKRCAVPFLRHLVYDCTGALTETRDTTPDGVTPYTPVEAVDCGNGGAPAMVEVPWEVVDIQPDPASPVGRGLIFTLSPIDDPDTVGTVTVTTSSSYNTSSCPAEPPEYSYRNPTTYTFTPNQALRDAATYIRCDLRDFDTFEPVTSLTPPPDRLGGTAYWDGTTVRPTESNQTGEMYYDGPPETWTYRVGNTGGGNSCSMLSFAAVSLRAEGCCAPCGRSGGGDGGGRTVQDVCVIASAAPDDVMQWTRVIEDGGATIYYLDQDGARYDSTLPAGHQIVACPTDGGEDVPECQSCETLMLCDVQPDESPGAPEIVYETVPLAELGPAGSYGGGSPVTGTLPNGVGYSVSVGEWAQAQGHYTFYPADSPQVWTFTEPVYVRFGLRGLNITPTECYVLPDGVTVESISPNHSWDPDSRTLCEIPGQGSATDESVFLLGPVTELPLTASGSSTGGRGPGLIQAGFPVETPAPGSSTTFLRTICRDCQGQVLSVTDTELDGATPYSPTGEVTACTASAAEPAEGREVEITPMCVINTNGAILQRILAEVTYDTATGERLSINYVDPATWGPVQLPGGARLDVCPEVEPADPGPDVEILTLCDLADGAEPVPFLRHLHYTDGTDAPTVVDTTLDGATPYTVTGQAGTCTAPPEECPARSVVEACRCDDTDGDGAADTEYVELLGVDCDGQLTPLGTYLPDLSAPYTPIAPVPCDTGSAPAPVMVQAHRIQLDPGGVFSAGAVPLLQSVTATAHGGTGTITTADGDSMLFEGESVTWSLVRDGDAALAGPLTITADTGTVTVAYTAAN